jgi:hypothetical protein
LFWHAIEIDGQRVQDAARQSSLGVKRPLSLLKIVAPELCATREAGFCVHGKRRLKAVGIDANWFFDSSHPKLHPWRHAVLLADDSEVARSTGLKTVAKSAGLVEHVGVSREASRKGDENQPRPEQSGIPV